MKLSPQARRLLKTIGREGGKTRAKRLSKERLREIGVKAAQARWRKVKETRP